VLPESVLASGAVVATGKVLLVLGVVDGTGRIIKYVPVLVDKNATPYQLTQAVENSMIGASEVLPGAMLMRNGQAGQRLGMWWRNTLAELHGPQGVGAKLFWRSPRLVTCFPAGTSVVMADGSIKPIDEVREGESVMAADPEKGIEAKACKVGGILHSKTRRLITIWLDSDGDGSEDCSVRATGEHPFWVFERGWINAEDLKGGDAVTGLSGPAARVARIEAVHSSNWTRTYNLDVAGIDAFYVLAGGTPVLVHNTEIGLGLNFNPTPLSDLTRTQKAGAITYLNGGWQNAGLT
jgi:hypothetical protein